MSRQFRPGVVLPNLLPRQDLAALLWLLLLLLLLLLLRLEASLASPSRIRSGLICGCLSGPIGDHRCRI